MAKIIRNPLFTGMRGKLGNVVFRQRRDGTIIMSAAPVSKDRKSTESQRAQQSRFQQAVAYARDAAKTEPFYAELAQRTHKTAYNIAISDWFHAPVIHEISRRSGHIRIDASDDGRVANVYVTILDEVGNHLEQGAAVLVNGAQWEYETDTQGNILVEALDLAGNITRQEAQLGMVLDPAET